MAKVETLKKDAISVINPATGQKVTEVPIASFEDVKKAVQRAREAFRVWREFSFKERAKYMYAARDWIVEHKEEIIDTICSETGKPRTEALLAEILYSCDILGFYAKNAAKFLRDERKKLHLLKIKKVYVSYLPMGVVGVISPWNYPFNLTLGETVPALMAGNAVIIKPSEFTPLSGLLVSRIFREVDTPKDLVQTLCGYGETGAFLIDECDCIAFTGSVETGKKVMERAAKGLKPILLELGGKDPMIVLKGADLERAANACVWGALANAGQICISVERVYVEEAVYDAFVAKVVEKVKTLRQGVEKNYGEVDVGPMITPEQLEIVERHVQDAVSKGAKVLVGGKRNQNLKGYFYEPTVLIDVDHSMQIMQEETFGPVIPIMKVKDAEEALRLANDSIYGLSSSVWTKNKRLGRVLARRVEAGNVCINDCLTHYLALEAPYGGIKQSGIGRRHGAQGIRHFCYTQTVLVDRLGLKRDPFWFPYDKKLVRLMERVINLLFCRGLRRRLGL